MKNFKNCSSVVFSKIEQKRKKKSLNQITLNNVLKEKNNVLNVDSSPQRFHYFGKVDTGAPHFFHGLLLFSSNIYLPLFLKIMSSTRFTPYITKFVSKGQNEAHI